MSALAEGLDVLAAPSPVRQEDTFEPPQGAGGEVVTAPARPDLPASNAGRGMALPPDQLEAYCDIAARMVQTAQLGEEFVDGDWVTKQLRALKHVDSLDTPLQLLVSDATGLPMRTAWNAIQSARKMARDNGDFRKLTGGKVWQQLIKLPERTLDTLKIEVLDVDPVGGARRFRLSYDCLADPGYLMRTTFVMQQPKSTGRDGNVPMQNLTGTSWTLHPELKSTLEAASASQLSVAATAALARWGDHCIEFTRGVIGPIYFAGVAQPAEIAEILDHYRGEAIGCFRSYRISRHAGADDTAAYDAWQDRNDALLQNLERAGFTAKIRELWVAPPAVAEELELRARLGERPLTVRQMY